MNVCIREKRARRGLSQDLVDLYVTRPRHRPTPAQWAFSWGAWVLIAVSLYIILLAALAINR